MSDPILLRSLVLAGEGMAVATLLPLLAWLSASCFPKWAALRHLIWTSAFIGLLVLPPLAFLLPAHFVVEPSIAPVIATSAAVDPARAVVPVRAIGDGVTAVPMRMLVREPAQMPAAVPAWHGLTLRQAADAVFALWLMGVAAILLYQIMALLGLYRLRYQSTAQEIPIHELRGPWQLRIATQPTAHGPLTWGFFRPVILLPFNALSWSTERLTAVLRHEIAHVHRYDTLTQMLAQFACAFYWPNPLVWFGALRLRRDAEIATDDAVLATGIKPSDYACALIALATEFRGYSSGLAMASPSALELRVKSVLAPTQSHIGVTAMDVLKTACLGSAVIALVALVRPDLAIAQQTAPVTSVARDSASPVAITPITPHVALTKAKPRIARAETTTPVEREAAALTAQVDQLEAKADTLRSQAAALRAKADALKLTNTESAALLTRANALVAQAEADPTNQKKAEAARVAADILTKAQAAEFRAAEKAKPNSISSPGPDPMGIIQLQDGIRVEFYADYPTSPDLTALMRTIAETNAIDVAVMNPPASK